KALEVDLRHRPRGLARRTVRRGAAGAPLIALKLCELAVLPYRFIRLSVGEPCEPSLGFLLRLGLFLEWADLNAAALGQELHQRFHPQRAQLSFDLPRSVTEGGLLR